MMAKISGSVVAANRTCSSIDWVVTQRCLVVCYRHFETSNRTPASGTETFVTNYYIMMCNLQVAATPQLLICALWSQPQILLSVNVMLLDLSSVHTCENIYNLEARNMNSTERVGCDRKLKTLNPDKLIYLFEGLSNVI
jgi:hypothetical protein